MTYADLQKSNKTRTSNDLKAPKKLKKKKNSLHIERRVSKQDDRDPDEVVSYGAYKSQQYRPLDIQW